MRSSPMKWYGVIFTVLMLLFIVCCSSHCFEAMVYNITMESESRVSGLQVTQVIETLRLKPGQFVADIGAGTGLFSRPMAQKIAPGGMLYAVDINPILLEEIDERNQEIGINNIKTVIASEHDPRIPETVDLIFMCATFHKIENKVGYLKTLRMYLKPEGRIAIVDLLESHPFPSSNKYSVGELKKWMKAAGYELLEKHDFLEDDDYSFTVFALSVVATT